MQHIKIHILKKLVNIKTLHIDSVTAHFFMLFKPKCPKCGSRDNKIECYNRNPYAKNERWLTGRQCNNCTNFWYK